MKKDNIDRVIKEKFDSRKMTPSISAWDRLEAKLDDNDKKMKTRWKSYFSMVASFLILLGFGYSYFLSGGAHKTTRAIELASIGVSKVITLSPNETIDVSQVILNKIEVGSSKIKKIDKVIAPEILKVDSITDLGTSFLASNDTKKDEVLRKTPVVSDKKSKIIVKGEDLLYAVTHSPEEVKNYYVANKINRESVIDSIKIELRKRNLKISPETILAQVEHEMFDDQFKVNFMQKVKVKISDIAMALTERNK
ncbi:hypothetical protein SAMN04489761_0418 [Tenacibaculum sp. MAR_2009_124]|uniref:hypothetical protein n=1 Tax=Tenacibaculum sp. MAR_2009_124 TaxID=1250059 RepID=UPI00089A789E|nr:hypothetical protein [Tenacibaculum sp. MAR_2009_124]SEB39452.1 hypothetical protein SAMN04489761_0418 [Tenacibaculum sp. MAR_2009_124]